jgi:polyhydroxyalkanoate synthase subunit PhaE
MTTRNNNIVDNILDTQKQVLDNVVESTKKFAGNNKTLNETIEKGNDWYKNWLETQKEMYNKVTGHTATENGKSKTESTNGHDHAKTANDYLQNWTEMQAKWAKQMMEMSQESAKKFGFDASANPFASFTNNNPFASFANSNPFANWQNQMNNASNPFASWMNQMASNNFMSQMQHMNPFTQDAFKKATDTLTETFNKYYSPINNNFTEWQKSFENGTVQDAYKNMIKTGEGFTKFTEMWMPMIKSMQDKTFNMEEYKKLMNPETYKEFMDQFFGFMPESSQDYMKKLSGMMNDNMKHMTEGGMNGYHQMRDMMNKFNNGQQMFGNINNAYTNWQSQMNEAVAPFTKMMTPNQYTTALQEWNDINNRVTEYNMKNAELQYMIYNQGAKIMDKLAEHTAKQIKEGKEVHSIAHLYQEWLNISDKVYVHLFESNEYSTLMGEVGAMQMKLKKDIELQTEKMFKDIPVATRSEMDEVYKTIYELKKKVRQLEKMLDMEGDEEETVAPKAKPAAKKTAKRTTKR